MVRQKGKSRRRSKKGKWRKLDRELEEADLAQQNRPSSSLYFEERVVAGPPQTQAERKKRAREKVTRTESLRETIPKKRRVVGAHEEKLLKKHQIASVSTGKKEESSTSLDLWGEAENPKQKKGTFSEFAEEVLESRKRVTKFKHRAPEGKATPSSVPDPGLSYRPDFEHHQDTLGVALAVFNEEDDRTKRLVAKVPKDSAIYVKADPLDMLDQPTTTNQEENEDESSDSSVEIKAKQKPRPKTRLQRNKEQRRKEEQRRLREKAQRKKKRANLAEVEKIAKQIEEEEEIKKERLTQQRQYRESRLREKPVQLGGHGYVPPKPEYLLTEELPDSLRQTPVASLPVRDLVDNIQRKNIMEPRKPNKKRRRYQLVRYTKPSVRFSEHGKEEKL